MPDTSQKAKTNMNEEGSLPRTITVAEQTLTLRPARMGDAEALHRFAEGLEDQDLLFLRVDITQPDVVRNWLANVESGKTSTLIAWQDEKVMGYCTVDRNDAWWTRRVGEIRINIAPQMRGKGLGRQLIAEIFDVARKLGLRKLMANMTPDQLGAQATFAKLGFRPEALLVDHIEDRDGHTHDLTIMSYSIDGLTAQEDAPLTL